MPKPLRSSWRSASGSVIATCGDAFVSRLVTAASPRPTSLSSSSVSAVAEQAAIAEARRTKAASRETIAPGPAACMPLSYTVAVLLLPGFWGKVDDRWCHAPKTSGSLAIHPPRRRLCRAEVDARAILSPYGSWNDDRDHRARVGVQLRLDLRRRQRR